MAVIQSLADLGPAAAPELSDRIIAATARSLDLPLLTTDWAIEESGLVTVINYYQRVVVALFTRDYSE